MRPKAPSTPRTKARLLDEAERLFARKGMEGCSIRDIVSAARANLAAVTYHFGSKSGLIQAVIARRLEPLNEERLRHLERAEREAGPGGPSLEEVLRAAIAPTIRLLREKPNFMRIVGRLLTSQSGADNRPPEAKALLERFIRAIAAAVPGVPPTEIAWRVHFIRGAMIYTWTGERQLAELTGERKAFQDEEAMVERLVSFGAAGLRAALPAGHLPPRSGASPRRNVR